MFLAGQALEETLSDIKLQKTAYFTPYLSELTLSCVTQCNSLILKGLITIISSFSNTSKTFSTWWQGLKFIWFSSSKWGPLRELILSLWGGQMERKVSYWTRSSEHLCKDLRAQGSLVRAAMNAQWGHKQYRVGRVLPLWCACTALEEADISKLCSQI